MMATAEHDIDDLKHRMAGAITSFKSDLSGLRTGRASAHLLDPIMVEAYGQSMPLNQVSTVNVPEPRMIVVQVWDKAMVAGVEKAIRESNIGISPVVDGTNLRLPMPELNEERRRELVKVAHQYTETSKVAARHVRRDGMEILKKLEKDKDIGQDDARVESDKVQKLTDDTIAEIDKLLAAKEVEIMQV
jgi:ribosome recycling factor